MYEILLYNGAEPDDWHYVRNDFTAVLYKWLMKLPLLYDMLWRRSCVSFCCLTLQLFNAFRGSTSTNSWKQHSQIQLLKIFCHNQDNIHYSFTWIWSVKSWSEVGMQTASFSLSVMFFDQCWCWHVEKAFPKSVHLVYHFIVLMWWGAVQTFWLVDRDTEILLGPTSSNCRHNFHKYTD